MLATLPFTIFNTIITFNDPAHCLSHTQPALQHTHMKCNKHGSQHTVYMQTSSIKHGWHTPRNLPLGICSCHSKQHIKSVQKLCYFSLCVQRQDSRAEARALQEQFLQQAKADLEAFQQNCCAAAAAHHLDSPASPAGTPPEGGAAGVQAAEQPPSSRPAEGTHTAADGAAYRCARSGASTSYHVITGTARSPISYCLFILLYQVTCVSPG